MTTPFTGPSTRAKQTSRGSSSVVVDIFVRLFFVLLFVFDSEAQVVISYRDVSCLIVGKG